jgi:hypothetical protein
MAKKRELACSRQLSEGAETVSGAARLAIAAIEDMLEGDLSPKEAAVVNTAAGRVLKACELHLKYGKAASPELCLPKT